MAQCGGDASCAIRVAVRVRPLAPSEQRDGAKTFMNYFPQSGQIALTSSKDPRMYAYDALFEPGATQETVYDTLAAPLLERVFGGYNATVIAYGQTGSGKTFTMGTDSEADVQPAGVGLTPRILNELFGTMKKDKDKEFVVRCSMLEIYEERVIDLLSDEGNTNLPLRENKGTVYVQNLTELPAGSTHEALSLLDRGCDSRTKAETAMNARSSRSHAVFTVNVHCTDPDTSTSWRSKLCLVDLAGSERLKKTLATGDRMREGIKINEGLLVLGSCIEMLSRSTPPSHVPYRDSKLTRLLQDSLGGNAATLLIACVSPADTNFEETMNTLRYAERAKRIKTKPIVNQDPMAAELLRLKALVQELQRDRLETSVIAPAAGDACASTAQQHLVRAERDALQAKLDDMSAAWADAVSGKSRAQADAVQWEHRYDKLVGKVTDIVDAIRDGTVTADSQCLERLEALANPSDATFVLEEVQKQKGTTAAASSEDEDLADEENDENFNVDGGEAHRVAAVEAFVRRQSAAQQTLQRMAHDLDAKHQLLAEYEGNGHTLAEYQQKLTELESTVDKVSKERDELAAQLKRAGTVGKLAEERRQKLKELEASLADHRKRQRDFQRLAQMKARSDGDIKGLKAEIATLKKARVDLSKQLRQDSEKYRKWKMSTDKRINHLQMMERRQAGQLKAAKSMHQRQLAVYQRRYEDACQTTKRMEMRAKTMVLLRSAHAKAIKEQRQAGKKCTAQAVARIKALLDDELLLCFDRRKAAMQYDQLVAHRTSLTKRVTALKRKLRKVEARRPTDDGAQVECDELQEHIDELTQQCELYSVEIRTLQCSLAQCEDSPSQRQQGATLGDTEHSKEWLSNLASNDELVEAVKHVFDQLITVRTEQWRMEQQLTGYQESLKAYGETCDHLQSELDGANGERDRALDQCQQRLAQAQSDCQKQIGNVLSVFDRAASGDDALTPADRQLLQCVADEHRAKLETIVGHMESEVLQLKEKLAEKQSGRGAEESRRPRARGIFKPPPGLTEEDVASASRPKKPLQKTHTTRSGRIVRMTLDKWSESDEGSDEENEHASLDDSDYINTPLPLHKRPAAKRISRAVGKRLSDDNPTEHAPPAKKVPAETPKAADAPKISPRPDDERELLNATFTLPPGDEAKPAAGKAAACDKSPSFDINTAGLMKKRQRRARLPALPGFNE